jgi:hypothetical protein
MRESSKSNTIGAKLRECLGDERGIALTEYLLLNLITLPMTFYLFHPDNGFYKMARDQYNATTLLLTFPGP